MGNKDAGRALANAPVQDYYRYMGGTCENIYNTGINFPNKEAWKYFKLFRDYALNRVKWTSNVVDERELRLIEWNIFHYGYCALVRPTITKNGIRFKSDKLRVFQCSLVDPNPRTGRPRTINIVNNYRNRLVMDTVYSSEDFVIFTDEFAFPVNGLPFADFAWECANKMYEIDLAFNANARKLRAPIVYNSGSTRQPANEFNVVNNPGDVTIADLMSAAYKRNEGHVVISENQVGEAGLLHAEPNQVFLLSDMIDAQDRIQEAYFKTLGLYTNKDKTGSYTVKELQEEGDETGDFRTKVWKANRLICAEEASIKFKINLALEVV